jgi:hypothetical protein
MAWGVVVATLLTLFVEWAYLAGASYIIFNLVGLHIFDRDAFSVEEAMAMGFAILLLRRLRWG